MPDGENSTGLVTVAVRSLPPLSDDCGAIVASTLSSSLIPLCVREHAKRAFDTRQRLLDLQNDLADAHFAHLASAVEG